MSPIVRSVELSDTNVFDELLPRGAVTVVATPTMWESGLLAEEEPYIINAVNARRREFTAGRNCARQALHMLGIGALPIIVGYRRAPAFPPGICGTITHAAEYCAASVMHQGDVLSIGIDAEVNTPLETEVRSLVLSFEENSELKRLPKTSSCNWDKLVFSIKESFYKAYFQLCKIELDFLDAHVSILAGERSFEISVLRSDLPAYFLASSFRGRFSFDHERVYAAVALPKNRL
ncbi:MAG: 4'-phosphopantetheinyl transferase superfamily protein [Pseudomonadota bacterium]